MKLPTKKKERTEKKTSTLFEWVGTKLYKYKL